MERSAVVVTAHGGPNDSGIDSLSTGPLARLFARSFALLTRSLAMDCSLRSLPPLRSLIRSVPHFVHFCLWESVLLMSQNDVVLSHSAL